MMFLPEMYTIITITLMMAAQGLHQTCSNYCNQSSNQSQSESRRECNCTAINEQNLSATHIASSGNNNSEIDYEPQKFDSSESTQADEKPFHSIMPKAKVSEYDRSSNETLSVGDEKAAENSTKSFGTTIEFPLYLDIDLHTPVDAGSPNLKDELIHIFERVRASEKHISECINLHIYIFSKNNDNINQTHTNWGHPTKHDNDNLSNSELLTEIQNKCDKPTTIIHESIYEIRQREHKGFDAQKGQESTENSSTYDAEANDSTQEELLSSTNRNVNHVSTDLENNVLLETTTIAIGIFEKGKVDRNGMEFHNPYDSSSATQSDEEYYNITTARMHEPILISDIEFRESTGHKGFRRGEYLEKDILIPKIITKEFANDTVISVIDGYETMPNFDFVSNYSNMSRTRDDVISPNETNAIIPRQTTPVSIPDIHNVNNNQSDLIQDIKGNLYFLFGNSQIPARFIQNSEGEMQLAVDGYSLCDQITLQQENKLLFMSLLCGCIKFHNCSRSVS